MARPNKQGLEYFPLDVSILSDMKLVPARKKFGYLASIIYLQLLCMIYSDHGYYLEYNDQTKDSIAFKIISETLMGKYQPDYKTVEDVIGELVACRLFSHDHYRLGFLTSHRIQITYFKATIKRKKVTVDPNIWIVNFDEMAEISNSHSLVKYVKNGVIDGNNRVNDGNNTQSKVNKSKVNKSKVNKSTVNKSTVKTFPRSREMFKQIFGREPYNKFSEKLQDLKKTDEEIADAISHIKNYNPDYPEAYALAVIHHYKPRAPISHRLYIDQHEPTGELQEWEISWLDEIGRLPDLVPEEDKENSEEMVKKNE